MPYGKTNLYSTVVDIFSLQWNYTASENDWFQSTIDVLINPIQRFLALFKFTHAKHIKSKIMFVRKYILLHVVL